MNVLFFIGTVYYLVDHWRKAAGVINSQVVESYLEQIFFSAICILSKTIFTSAGSVQLLDCPQALFHNGYVPRAYQQK